MNKADKQTHDSLSAARIPEGAAVGTPTLRTAARKPIATEHRGPLGGEAKTEILIRLRREDYLRVAVEEVTLLDGKEIARRVLHAPDSPGVALGKAYEALERMVET